MSLVHDRAAATVAVQGNMKVLWFSFLAFSLGFAIWGMFSALGPFLIQWYHFSPSQAPFLAAMPPLFATLASIPLGIAADLSPLRLSRFFTPEPDGRGYRIHKSIRDMLVFSEQDVIKDPPFSRLDLISCRNLLIYLDVELQKRLIPLFHYALKPGGRLFLGTSEGIGEFGDLFAVLDRKAKLYQRKPDFAGAQRALQVPERVLDDDPVLAATEQQSNGRVVLRLFQEIICRREVQVELPDEAWVERYRLQLDHDVGVQAHMIEKQIHLEV